MLSALETTKVLGVPARWLVLAAAFAILAWNLDLRWEMVFQYRTELGGVEHNVVHGIQKVLLGLTLYEDPEAPPFDVIQYTPAYYVLCASIAKVLGIAGDDVRSIYLLCRVVALVLNVITCLLVYRCCRVAGAASWASIFAACVTFCCFWEHYFTRMDALQSAASMAAFLQFLRWTKDPRDGLLIQCSAWAVLGFMAKQSGIVAMAAPVLYLLLNRQWRPLGVSMLATTVFLLIALAGTFLLGTPWHFYQNTVQGLANGFSNMMYRELFDPATYKYFIGWHVLVVIIVVQGLRSSSPTFRFLALAAPLSLLFALITGLKHGSRPNYLHESLVLTFIGTAALLDRLKAVRWRNVLGWCFALYGGIFAAYRTNSALAWYRVGEPDAANQQLLKDDLALRNVLLNDLHLAPDEYIFITYREYLEHFFVGQSLLTQKDIVQFSTYRIFDYDRFHTAMRDGTVRFVITDKAPGPVTYLDSTYTDWAPVYKTGRYTILGRSAQQ